MVIQRNLFQFRLKHNNQIIEFQFTFIRGAKLVDRNFLLVLQEFGCNIVGALLFLVSSPFVLESVVLHESCYVLWFPWRYEYELFLSVRRRDIRICKEIKCLLLSAKCFLEDYIKTRIASTFSLESNLFEQCEIFIQLWLLNSI